MAQKSQVHTLKLQRLSLWIKRFNSPSQGSFGSPKKTFLAVNRIKVQHSFVEKNRLLSLNHFLKTFLPSFLLIATIGNLTACSYKSPAVEEPVPVENEIPKSFFVNTNTDAQRKMNIDSKNTKKFLCGWASEMEVGPSAHWFYTNNVIMTEHCNLTFEVTESALIGKLINPSFPNDPSRWQIALQIPISSHHYVEREKDSAGRDTQRVIRNSSRSHWSARPNMLLNFENINLEGVFRSGESQYGMYHGNIKVSKIEWDQKNGFLGFTIEKAIGNGDYARVRFNIKEFKTNSQFVETPFNDKNYKYMNVLHVLGQKLNGVNPILKAGHWDLSKKIEIRLWNFPEKYKDLMKEIVGEWNEIFHKNGSTPLSDGPFVVSDTPAEHAFDLRYPTIAWISDERISEYSPLGVGMTIADVSNGEIKWGMITLYGGYLETYMKSYLDTSSGSSLTAKTIRLAKSLVEYIKKPKMLRDYDFGQALQNATVSDSLIKTFNPAADLSRAQGSSANSGKTQGSGIDQSLASYFQSKNTLEKLLSYNKVLAQKIQSQAQSRIQNEDLTQLLRSEFLKAKNSDQPSNDSLNSENFENQISSAKAPKTSVEFKSQLMKKYSGPGFCHDRLVKDVMPAMTAALGKTNESAGSLANDEKRLRHLVKELISHEYGHFLGLGHQFKESILPAKGKVPDSIYNSLASLANEQNHYTNYTSVMGYRNPKTELHDKSTLKPGPHDELVLRFLYNQEYSTFKTGDAQFTFAKVPVNGIIPEFNKDKPEFKTSYFPQCNDLDASYGFDPFCNRFDMGHNATSIVQFYFDDLRATLPQSVVAFTDTRGDAQEAEGRLWTRSLNTLSRVRIFYDYMRVYYKDQFDEIRADEDALMNFSQSCQQNNIEAISHPKLKKIFSEKPELIDLCRANALALKKMKELVTIKGPDYTKMDITKHISPGGLSGGEAERDYSQILGTWKELSVFPLKYASLMALSEPSAWVMFDGQILPNFLYSTPQTLFSYMYIYPREYTDVMASNLKMNLQFAGPESPKTALGRSITSMLWMNWTANYENKDAGLFPESYKEKIRSQQAFDVGVVALILKGNSKNSGSPDRIVSWTGELFDFASNKSVPLSSAFLLPKGKVIATASDMILFPITTYMPYLQKEGYVYAYKLQLNQTNQQDGLSDLSAKKDLADHGERLIMNCLNGQDNGLKAFFNSTNPHFEGFRTSEGLAQSDELKKQFLDSVDQAFDIYYSNKSPQNGSKILAVDPDRMTCSESLRGIGLLISAGAIMNGYLLPETFDYIQ